MPSKYNNVFQNSHTWMRWSEKWCFQRGASKYNCSKGDNITFGESFMESITDRDKRFCKEWKSAGERNLHTAYLQLPTFCWLLKVAQMAGCSHTISNIGKVWVEGVSGTAEQPNKHWGWHFKHYKLHTGWTFCLCCYLAGIVCSFVTLWHCYRTHNCGQECKNNPGI